MPLAGLPIGKRSALLLDKENMTKYSISPMSSLYELYLRHPRISTDSRRIEPDSVFFALRGASFDGNRFAADALEKGAAYAVVDDPSLPNTRPDKADRLIVVDDALQTLQTLAREHRRELGLPILAITGSNGKTTTKELVSRVLAEKYEVYATRGNLNNHIGVPLSILRAAPSDEAAVWEMGMNHSGELAPLCEMTRPKIGIITSIGTSHMEYLGSRENIAREKCTLAHCLPEDGFMIFPADCDYADMIRQSTRAACIDCGIGAGTVRAENPVSTENGTRFILSIPDFCREEVELLSLIHI